MVILNYWGSMWSDWGHRIRPCSIMEREATILKGFFLSENIFVRSCLLGRVNQPICWFLVGWLQPCLQGYFSTAPAYHTGREIGKHSRNGFTSVSYCQCSEALVWKCLTQFPMKRCVWMSLLYIPWAIYDCARWIIHCSGNLRGEAFSRMCYRIRF